MKKFLFVLAAILFSNLIFSQNAAVKIVDQKTGNTIIIQEKSRIRIKTFDGKRITGRFQILNGSTISLNGKEISLANIKKIKRNPLLMTIATDVVLIIVGGTMTAILAFSGTTAPAVMFGGGGTIAAMILGPNLLKGYTTSKYDIEFVNIDSSSVVETKIEE